MSFPQFTMFRCHAFLFALFIPATLAASDIESVCPTSPRVVGENGVSIYGTKQSNKWVTTILSYFGTEGTPESPNLEVSQKVIKCDEKEIVQVKVVLRGSRREENHTIRVTTPSKDALRFYESGGRNIMVFNDGRTVYRKNEVAEIGYAGILTNRPLKDDELFEVILERLITNHGDSLGIGVTTFTPTTVKYDSWMSSSTAILFNVNIYGTTPKGSYGPDLRKLPVGSRVGVMRKKNGNIHFYVNGVDQGIAAVNVAAPVYGVLDLYGNTVQVSIVSK